MAKQAKKKNRMRKVTVALLDETGLLAGYDRRSVGPDWIGEEGCIHVPDGCDLAPGKYRWNAAGGRFDPLPPNEPPASEMLEPSSLRAIWLGFKALQEGGQAFPAETAAWIEAYGKTMDAKG